MMERTWTTGNLCTLSMVMELVQLLKKTVWCFLKKTKNRATIWSSNPTTGHIPTENKILKRYMYSSVHCSTIYNSQDMEATQMSINRWMDKDVMFIYNGILLSHKKKNEMLPFAATWMDLEIITPSEASQIEKDKYHMISFIWEILKKMSLFREQK